MRSDQPRSAHTMTDEHDPAQYDPAQYDAYQYDTGRRGLLKCMTWAGSAMLWPVAGAIPRSQLIRPGLSGPAEAAETGFSFAQVSDSHLGFDRPVNTNV